MAVGFVSTGVQFPDSTIQTSASSPTSVSDQTNNSTGYFDLPAGTTAQRPVSPAVGMVRYNTSISQYEGYTVSGWSTLYSYTSYSVSYLIVAGGGCGGGQNGGGGGAGGMLTGDATLTPGTTYSTVIGAGGISAQGANTTALGFTAIGGGVGTGGSGGSGAGGFPGAGGAGTAGQGNAGGSGINSGNFPAGGGGGKGAQGGNAPNTSTGGNGGAGGVWSVNGATYAGGGGGGVNPGTGGSGGSGGGGAGSNASASPTPGTVNTGGGGGGGNNNRAGTGGSGIVIFAVPTMFYTGIVTGSPTITTSGSLTLISFTSSGSYTA